MALGELLVSRGDGDEALALLERIPESERTRNVAAAARLGSVPERRLRRHARRAAARVKADDDARQEFVDILELMGPDDPRTADYRRRLTAQLFYDRRRRAAARSGPPTR